MTVDIASFARKIPKAELHVHLEGTMTPSLYARIAARNGLEVTDAESLYRCEDFQSFLTCFLKVVRALQTPRDFAELAREYFETLPAQGVRHVEFFLSPATQRKFVPELDLEAMVHAVHDAAREARAKSGITSSIIFDMVRNLGEAEAFLDIELAQECRDYGVVGIGLGGDERNFPARDFRHAFERAGELEFHRTAHAGEAAGVESVIEAVELLGAERIGHGVAVRGQPRAQALLKERNVAIDACPTSNEITGAVKAGEEHPLREFIDAGITVSLSSDDPAFFQTTIADEYVKVARSLAEADALSGAAAVDHEGRPLHSVCASLAKIAKNSFMASFLGEDAKRKHSAEVDDYFAGITR